MRQSLVWQGAVEFCPGEGRFDSYVVTELAVVVRVSPPRLDDEHAEITLSVLRPTGVLSLVRSRDVTIS